MSAEPISSNKPLIHKRQPFSTLPEPQTDVSYQGGLTTLNNAPSALKPDHILALQRTIGNRAVNRLVAMSGRQPTIQRRLMEGKDFLDKTNSEDHMLIDIAYHVTNYNVAYDKANEPPEKLFDLLRRVDRAIYAWFAEATRRHQTLEQAAHYNTVEALRIQAEKEHSELIKRHRNVLPFSVDGLPLPEVLHLTKLWNDIREGISKIRLVGDEANRDKTLADLAKLLNTPMGRRILTHLSMGSPDDLLTHVYIGQTKKTLPESVRNMLEDPNDSAGSFAQPLGGKESSSMSRMRGPFPIAAADRESGHYLEANTVQDFRRAALEGKQGVLFQGQKFEFSVGAGSYVQVSSDRERMSNEEGHELLSPDFVKLGHELGHAAGIRSGALGIGSPTDGRKKEQDAALMSQMTGKDEFMAGVEWETSEELINVQSVENALRQESGASEQRGFYHGRDLVLRHRRARALGLDALMQGYRQRDPVVKELNPYQQLQNMRNNLADDAVFEQCRQYIGTLPQQLDDAEIRKAKAHALQRRFDAISAAISAQHLKIAEQDEFNWISTEMLSNLNSYVGVAPNSPFFTLYNRLNALGQKFGLQF